LYELRVDTIRWLGSALLYGGVITVTVGIWTMTPETANGRGAVPLVSDTPFGQEPIGAYDAPAQLWTPQVWLLGKFANILWLDAFVKVTSNPSWLFFFCVYMSRILHGSVWLSKFCRLQILTFLHLYTFKCFSGDRLCHSFRQSCFSTPGCNGVLVFSFSARLDVEGINFTCTYILSAISNLCNSFPSL